MWSKGYCHIHYNTARKEGIVGKKIPCGVEGCDKFSFLHGYCEKHWQQIEKHGKAGRTQFDPNEFWIEGDTCFIQLYDRQGNKKNVAMVDAEDRERCEKHKWRCSITLCGVWYVSTMIGRKTVALHNFINGLSKDGLEIDHKDRNGFNNRKDNLREGTRSDNMCNLPKKAGKRSKYKGVGATRSGKWRAMIQKNNVTSQLGVFNKEEDAAMAYNEAAKRLHGDFAWLNAVGGN